MNIFIIPIEPLETRYTAQWYEHFPKLIVDAANSKGNTDVKVHVIDGEITSSKPTEGAFLDFAATNIYKSTQIAAISKFFADGRVNDGDHIIFLDAWHPGIIQMKYMKDLLNIDVNLHGLWHAGSYDPQDFLGRLIKDKHWSNSAEQSMFYSLDYNWFATDFHANMFTENVFELDRTMPDNQDSKLKKIFITGWPMEYMDGLLKPFKQEKEDIILFPHRIAPEKQHDIFLELAKLMPEYKFVTCQDKELTKDEYHDLLGKSKVVFSANLQETLGISGFEGALLGAIPFVPDRLSYAEMYYNDFKYPSEWTESFSNFQLHKHKVVARLRSILSDETDETMLVYQAHALSRDFFSAQNILDKLF